MGCGEFRVLLKRNGESLCDGTKSGTPTDWWAGGPATRGPAGPEDVVCDLVCGGNPFGENGKCASPGMNWYYLLWVILAFQDWLRHNQSVRDGSQPLGMRMWD